MADKVDFQFLLWFDLPGDEMYRRLNIRASQNRLKFQNGEIKELRSDDQPEVMKNRIRTFENSTRVFTPYKVAGQ